MNKRKKIAQIKNRPAEIKICVCDLCYGKKAAFNEVHSLLFVSLGNSFPSCMQLTISELGLF